MNKLLRCDCVEGMKELPDDFIDLTVTSPPYDGLRAHDLLPIAKFQQAAKELLRVTKPGGVVVWVVQEQIRNGSQTGTSSEQRRHFRDIGFLLWDRLIMARHGRRNLPRGRYGMPVEEAFILSKGKPRTVNVWQDKRNRSPARVHTFQNRHRNGQLLGVKEVVRHNKFGTRTNIWRYAVGLHVASEAWVRRAAHGALMPERMAEDLILSYSKPDDLVFDPFCGLATTCKLALLNHRRYLGIEVNEMFFRLAQSRMRLAHVEYRGRLDQMLAGGIGH
jgi:DNA modification methylase